MNIKRLMYIIHITCLTVKLLHPYKKCLTKNLKHSDLTRLGLDIDNIGNRKSKETQPHNSPLHFCHCGLAVTKEVGSKTAASGPLY